MREIKFRYWDAIEGDWCDAEWVADNANEVLNDWLTLEGIPKEIYVSQYTGLKDKNGVEIYEGDIVNKGYHNLDTFDEINAVSMGDGADSDGYTHREWYGWKAGSSSLLDVANVCEVIGNIYQNKDLLK